MEKIRFDPMFSLFDIMIDPVYYLDRPLIGINYLPLRQAILYEHEQDPANQGSPFNAEGWLKTGMVSPRMANRYATPAFNKYTDSEPFRAAVGKLDRATRLFTNSVGNSRSSPPETRDKPWLHLGALPDDAPARSRLPISRRPGEQETRAASTRQRKRCERTRRHQP